MEKFKESFKAEQAGWETEKAALLKRAEDAEAALEPVSSELAGLKQQINAMTAAVFGKIISFYSLNICLSIMLPAYKHP